ncbi:MAG: nuclear transport factor 2 family protein, partial [Vicinamibacterales bacterium]
MSIILNVEEGRATSATIPLTNETLTVIRRFEESFNRHDPDALMADMTEDCIFEHVAPEGAGIGRHEGHGAVRAVWASLPEHFPNYRFETEDLFATGERAAYRWRLRWDLPEGGQGELRG